MHLRGFLSPPGRYQAPVHRKGTDRYPDHQDPFRSRLCSTAHRPPAHQLGLPRQVSLAGLCPLRYNTGTHYLLWVPVVYIRHGNE